MLRLLGVDLRLVPTKPYKDPGNYVRYSEQLVNEMKESLGESVIWANQFDNIANQEGHIDIPHLKSGSDKRQNRWLYLFSRFRRYNRRH